MPNQFTKATATGTLANLNDTVGPVKFDNQSLFQVSLAAGLTAGTVALQCSYDNGSNYMTVGTYTTADTFPVVESVINVTDRVLWRLLASTSFGGSVVCRLDQ